MRPPASIILDGKRYLWRDLVALRKAQQGAPKAQQLALFDGLPSDARPQHERSAAARYQTPSLWTLLEKPLSNPKQEPRP